MYARYFHKDSLARKRETTQYNTAKLCQPKQNMVAPMRRDTAHAKVVYSKQKENKNETGMQRDGRVSRGESEVVVVDRLTGPLRGSPRSGQSTGHQLNHSSESGSQLNTQSCGNFFLWKYFNCSVQAGIACCLARRTRDQKVASSNPGRSGGRIFFSRVNFMC